MSNFRCTALASVINLALLGIHDAQAADTEALEKRIRELEGRLAKMDQLEARLEKLDQAAALSAKPATAAPSPAAPSPEVVKLTRKVNTLERKLEVQDEVSATALKKLPVFDAGSKGFSITSADKKHQLRIGSTLQTDAKFFIEDNGNKTDTLNVTRARIKVQGYVFRNIYYKFMPDFAASGNILPDAYLDYAYDPAAEFLVGKFKPSVSLERLQSADNLTFLERAFPTSLAPNRDVGIQVHGAFAKPGYKAEIAPGTIDTKNFFTYQIAVDNGSGDNGNPNYSGADTNNNKEFVGRVFAHPFQHTSYTWLEGLGIGLAGSADNPNKQALINQATPIGRTTYLNYASTYTRAVPTPTVNNKGAVVYTNVLTPYAAPASDGDRHRIYPQVYWYAGPFGVMGEYVESSQHLSGTNKAGKAVNIQQNNKAWQVLGSYVLTGEDNTFGMVNPIRNFNPFDGKWGAWQLAARWTEMSIDKSTFEVIDPDQASNHATAWTLGVNWYLDSNAKISSDFEQVNFKGGAANGGNRPTENVFATRFQLAF